MSQVKADDVAAQQEIVTAEDDVIHSVINATQQARGLRRRSELLPSSRESEMIIQIVKLQEARKQLPANASSWEDAYLVALRGLDLGMSPVEAADRLYLVERKDGSKRVAMMTEAKVAQVRKLGIGTFKIEQNGDSCCVTGVRTATGETFSSTWSRERVIKAGLMGKSNWESHYEKMIVWRPLSDVCDVLFNDAMYGVASAEFTDEAEDMDGVIRPIGDEVLESQRADRQRQREEAQQRLATKTAALEAKQEAAPAEKPRSVSPPSALAKKASPALPAAQTPAPEAKKAPELSVPITEAQVEDIRSLLRLNGWDSNQYKSYLQKKFNVVSARNLTAKQAAELIADETFRSGHPF